MARARTPHPIQTVLSGLLKRAKQQQETMATLQRAWRRIAGKQLAAHAKPVSLRHRRLIVCVEDPGDSFTLSYEKEHLLDQLRHHVEEPIDEMVLRPGEPTRRDRARRARQASRRRRAPSAPPAAAHQ